MTTNRELMQQALDALYENTSYSMQGDPLTYQDQRNDDTIKALEARLAQPIAPPEGYALIAIDALKAWGKYDEVNAACCYPNAALAQIKPEPVAWGIANTRPTEKQPLMMVMLDKPEPSHLVVALYTAPPQREWVGMTHKERCELWNIASKFSPDAVIMHDYAREIEAALREKNA